MNSAVVKQAEKKVSEQRDPQDCNGTIKALNEYLNQGDDAEKAARKETFLGKLKEKGVLKAEEPTDAQVDAAKADCKNTAKLKDILKELVPEDG